MATIYGEILSEPPRTQEEAQPIEREAFPPVRAILEGQNLSGWWDNVASNADIERLRDEGGDHCGMFTGYMTKDAVATHQNHDLKLLIGKLERGRTTSTFPDEVEDALSSHDEDPIHVTDAASPYDEDDEAGAGSVKEQNETDQATAGKPQRILLDWTDELEAKLCALLLEARPLMEAGISQAEINDRSGPHALDPNEPIENYESNTYRLTAHQRDGIGRCNYFITIYKGMLIADEMGLGKTAIVIGHIQLLVNAARLEGKSPIFGIVVPKSLVTNWTKELKKSSTIRFCDYSNCRHMTATELAASFDVIIIPNKILANEYNQMLDQYTHRHAEREGRVDYLDDLLDKQPGRVDRPFVDTGPLDFPLFHLEFTELVIDEAHCIKNPRTLLARGMRALNSLARIAITGTPLQNRVHELGALLYFLGIPPFNDPAIFRAAFTSKKTNGLKKKKSRNNVLYNDAILCAIRSAISIRRTKDQDFDGKTIMGIPDYDCIGIPCLLSSNSEEFQQQTRDMWDPDLKRLLQERAAAIQETGVDPDPSLPDLPHRNLNDALVQMTEARLHVIHPDLPHAGYDEFGKQNLSDLQPGAPAAYGATATLDNNENNLDAQNVMSTEATFTAYKKKLSGADIKSRDQRRQDFLKPYKAKNSLLWESDRLASVVEHIEERVAKHQQDAEALPEGLERSHYLATHKVLAFCEFLSALDLIKIALDQQGIDSLRYDGTVPMKKRDAAVAQFEEHDKDFEVEGTKADPVMVMLITNKAGNEGINLVHAVDVVIVAPTWNPYVEDLLIGRAARSGQQNTVQVFRFYSWDSIERKVRMTQMDKRATVERVLDDVYLLNFKHIIRRGTEDEFLDMVGYARCKSAIRRGVLKI